MAFFVKKSDVVCIICFLGTSGPNEAPVGAPPQTARSSLSFQSNFKLDWNESELRVVQDHLDQVVGVPAFPCEVCRIHECTHRHCCAFAEEP